MKRLFIFFVVLCCGLHLSAMGETAIEKAITEADATAVENLLKNNSALADTERADEKGRSMFEHNIKIAREFPASNAERLTIARLLINKMKNFNVETKSCYKGISSKECTLLDQTIDLAKSDSRFTEIVNLLKQHGAQTYAELQGSGNSSASNQSSSQRQANNVSSNTQSVMNTETKKENENKEHGTADKNIAAGEPITVSGTLLDEKTKEAIPFANIIVEKDGEQINGGSSRFDGVFSFEEVPVDAIIKISVLGYEGKQFNANSDLQTVELTPTATELKETIIEECRENSPVLSCVIERDIAAIKNTNVSGNDDKIFAHGYTYFQLPDEVDIDGFDDAIKVFESKCEALKGTNNIKNVSTELDDENNFYKPANQLLSNAELDTQQEYIIARCRITECDTEAGYELQDNTCVKKQNDVKQKPEQPKKPDCKDGAEWNGQQCVCKQADYIYKDDKCVENKDLKEKRKAYDDAKEKANRTLTAATVAATGIGGMELARGLAEQSADRDAVEDMEAYIATMRCEYGNGKSVKTIDVKNTEIELPGGNDQNIMNYRAQYLTLAADLKVRKEALGMKPGIESEEILDKATAGLYDDENTDITSGSEASLYRAQMLKSEKDKTKLDEASAASQRRVTGGAIATGVGVVVGVVGDSLINGKLGEKLKENKDRNSLISEIKNGLKSRGFTNIDKLDFSKIDISTLIKLQDIDWNNLSMGSQKDITKVLNTTNTTSFMSSFSELGLGDAFK